MVMASSSSTLLLTPTPAASTSLLLNLTLEPLQFGPPVARASATSQLGTREVTLCPKSPPRTTIQLPSSAASTLDSIPSHAEESISRSSVPLAWPTPLASHKRPAAGLVNPSMACYANATLQILLHTPPVLATAMAHQTDSCRQRHDKGFCMLCALHILAIRHWQQKRHNPIEVHGHLSKIRKGFSKNRQEDTHEFFRFVTDGLQATEMIGRPKNVSEKIKQSTWVYQTWGGQVRSRVVCSKCQKPSDTFDSFLDVSLDVNRGGRPRLVNMLQGFIKEDRLEGDNKYHCENCKAKANATKSFRIAKAPPILTFHLKRFSVNFNSYNGRARADKYNQFIEYPEMIDISPYMVDKQSPGTKYRLFGVTCHRGAELRFGHYTSYARGPDGRWFHADDDDVSPVSLKEALADKTAYLLSYIRVGDDEEIPNGDPVSFNSPKKRKLDDESPRTSDKPFKRPLTAHLPPAPRLSPSPSPTISPSGSPEVPRFGYQAKNTYRPATQSAKSFYGTPSPSNRDFSRKKNKQDRSRGAPMPFKHGNGRGRSKGNGMIGRMKGRS